MRRFRASATVVALALAPVRAAASPSPAEPVAAPAPVAPQPTPAAEPNEAAAPAPDPAPTPAQAAAAPVPEPKPASAPAPTPLLRPGPPIDRERAAWTGRFLTGAGAIMTALGLAAGGVSIGLYARRLEIPGEIRALDRLEEEGDGSMGMPKKDPEAQAAIPGLEDEYDRLRVPAIATAVTGGVLLATGLVVLGLGLHTRSVLRRTPALSAGPRPGGFFVGLQGRF